MKEYSWPGNIRELKHAIERAVLICGGGPITPEHLLVERMRGMIAARPEARAVTIVVPEPRLVPPPKTPTAMPVRGSPEEAQWIMRALEDAGGNQTLAARALGISRRTLVNRLNEYKDVRRPRKDKKS